MPLPNWKTCPLKWWAMTVYKSSSFVFSNVPAAGKTLQASPPA
jgi:hypothetical protein